MFHRLLVLAAIFSLSGGHVGMTQMLAWGVMLKERSAEQDLSFAMETTFSGDHPCELCLAIQNAEKSSEKEAFFLENGFRPFVLGALDRERARILPPSSSFVGVCLISWGDAIRMAVVPEIPPPRVCV